MGVKLSPPLLEGTIPAFYSSGSGTVITVPFSMNRAVGRNQIKGFSIKIKTVHSGNELFSTNMILTNTFKDQCIDERVVEFNIPNSVTFRVGQFYKIQIAYIANDDEETVGYFSTVSIAKCTTKPTITINGLNNTYLNAHLYTYEGICEQSANGDTSERIYSYRFDLYDSNSEILATSGDMLHNIENDENLYVSSDHYTFPQDLEEGKEYRIQYTITTINGLTLSSRKYRLTQKKTVNPEINAKLIAVLNSENGYIDLSLSSLVNEEGRKELTTGSFIISRACKDSNYKIWEELKKFKLSSQMADFHLWRDFTVEQGKSYIYAIQQYNDYGLYSNRIKSDIVYVDFEHAFLFDGDRQLKIKYNPKVSSFKKDVLETKVDTIGSQYPFIFRNSNVSYNEFPISGLISYWMDEEQLFSKTTHFDFIEKTTNLISENIAREREFKMEVLEWLSNGEPKLFRSPSEGNFIVRLMNNSLTPNDTLGRMLHTFSCTAYEVAQFNYDNSKELNFINTNEVEAITTQWSTLEFFDPIVREKIQKPADENNLLDILGGYLAKTVRFDNMNPGDIITIRFVGSGEEKKQIQIGVTGSYYIDTGVDIEYVAVQTSSRGSLTYSFNFVQKNIFNTIDDVSIKEHAGEQFAGECDIIKEITSVYDSTNNKWVKNPKIEITKIYSLKIEKRPLQRIIRKDQTLTNIKKSLKDSFYIYEIGTNTAKPSDGVSPSRPGEIFKLDEYYDAYNSTKSSVYEPLVKVDNVIVSVNETEEITYNSLDNITSIQNGNGVFTTISYQTSEIEYQLEKEADNIVSSYHYLYPLKQAKKAYNTAVKNLNNFIEQYPNNIEDAISQTKTYQNAVKTTYTNYILALVEAQKEFKSDGGKL